MKIVCCSVIALFAVFLFCFERVKACSCIRQQPCEASANADAIFAGKVLDTSEREVKIKSRQLPIGGEWEEVERIEKHQVSRIEISEIFLGLENEKEISVETEVSSSCGFPLMKDVSYLIYAKRGAEDNRFYTGMCTRTTTLANAKEDLKYLRSISKITAGSTIKGMVTYSLTRENAYQTEEDPKQNYNNLLSLGVSTVLLENDKSQLKTQIAPDGTYQFENIPEGKYKLKVSLPESLRTLDDYNPDIAKELEIGDQSEIIASGHGCVSKNFAIVDNGRISGKVTDPNGKPVADIKVYLIPVTKTGARIKTRDACYDNGLCLSADENGEFSFNGLSAGRYLVGVRVGDYVGNRSVNAAYPKAYFPGAASESKALPVIIQKGKSATSINFKIFHPFSEREIKGRVFFKDGRPAAKVQVRYVARTPDFKDNGITFIKTDENGYFTFTGYENHAYLVGAFTDQGDGNNYSQAVEAEVLVAGKVKEIKLVLDQSDDECPKCRDYHEFVKKQKK